MDWFARARDLGVPSGVVPQVVVVKRIHDRNASMDVAANDRELLSLLRRSVLRKRLTVSVVLPVRNGAAYLAEAIGSVLAQDLAPLEILVVDDDSTDGSAGIAERAGPLVRVLRRPALGAGAARNFGAREARGAWLAFLDADDRWLPGKQRRQSDALAASPGAAMAFGHIRQFFSPELMREGAPSPQVLPGVIPSTAWIARDAFLGTGGFSETLRASEWGEWYVRAQERGLSSVMVPEVVAERRIHARNSGAKRDAARAEYLRLVRGALDRKRSEARTP